MGIVLLFGGSSFIATYVAYPNMKKYMIDPFYNKDGTRKEDGDEEEAEDEELPASGKPGGYGEDDGEYYDAGEYITDENEMRSHKKDTQK